MSQAEFNVWLDSPWARGWIGSIELLEGHVVCEPPAGYRHSDVASEILMRMRSFVSERRLGKVFDSSCGLELPCGSTVGPDVCFISDQRFAARQESSRAFLRAVPELIVEVSSPSTSIKDRTTKRRIYERNPVHEYWLVDRRKREVARLVKDGDGFDGGRVYRIGETVSSTVLEGFELPVAELFADE